MASGCFNVTVSINFDNMDIEDIGKYRDLIFSAFSNVGFKDANVRDDLIIYRNSLFVETDISEFSDGNVEDDEQKIVEIEAIEKQNVILDQYIVDNLYVEYVILSLPDDYFSDIVNNNMAIDGPCRFYRQGESFFGNGKTYNSKTYPNGAKWSDVIKAADASIIETKDVHHVYLEGFKYEFEDDDGTKVYSMSFGS